MNWGRKWLINGSAEKIQLVLFDGWNNSDSIDVKQNGSNLYENLFFKKLKLHFFSKLD